MRAIILAAGIGYRLLPLTQEIPKCMVQVAGRTILKRAVDALIENGIRDIVIVVGYKKEMIKAYLSSTYGDEIAFTWVENDIYDKTNNIYSLWLAAQWFDDDVILLESDIVFDHGIIAALLAIDADNVIVVDACHGDSNGTVVRVDDDGNVFHLMTRDHLQFPHEKSDLFKTVNIYKFSRDFLKQSFLPILKNRIETRAYSKYYELILGIIIYLDSPKLKALSVGRYKWCEIDTYPDLVKADYLFSSAKQKIGILEQGHGGLWNYSGFTDFFYMRNAYFPPDELICAMQRRLGALMQNYSSRQDTLNKKASMLEYLNEAFFFLFNGSSQGIKLLSSMVGTLSIPVPTFQEYIDSLAPDRVHPYRLPLDTFACEPAQFAREALDASVDTLVLVNPNNPSSHLIEKEKMVSLLETYANRFRFIVVDESFIDFADHSQSLQDQVDRFENLIIVKSLGKAYGIAGLRLGYIYSSSAEVKRAIETYMPIWNSNSLAEFFIEEALKYRENYVESLCMTRRDRDDFLKRLETIPYLKVFAPRANFIMVEIKAGFSLDAAGLQEYLFDRHGIWVKNLAPKINATYPTYRGNGLLRFAVLKKEDNDRLCQGLEQAGTIRPHQG
jgi:histidinol-phosphate/aromatic aminotransferase/cobyric acid decarboxylase-like protein/choline kinase